MSYKAWQGKGAGAYDTPAKVASFYRCMYLDMNDIEFGLEVAEEEIHQKIGIDQQKAILHQHNLNVRKAEILS